MGLSRGRRALRAATWVAWFVVVPAALAEAFREVVATAASAPLHGALGWPQAIIADQPVPALIVAFLFFEMGLWRARLRLPLASVAFPPPRADVPASLRGPFDRASALLAEAESLWRRNTKAVTRDLSANERATLRATLEHLEATMEAAPFDHDRFEGALLRASDEVEERLARWRKSDVRQYLESVALAIAVALSARAFVVEAFKIPSGSMIPTLQVGDHIFVSKLAYGLPIPWGHRRAWEKMPPDRGDVIVFVHPEHADEDLIKRVIALPGDTLEARAGHPIVNGWEVPSCLVGVYGYDEAESSSRHREGDLYVEYLGDEAFLTLYDHEAAGFPQKQGPFVVGPGEVYVMGDNRNNSHDSRMWWGGRGGGAPFQSIKGKALFVWLSISSAGVDGSRFGAPIMGRPRLPAAMRHLEGPLDACLKGRPSLAASTPPPPK